MFGARTYLLGLVISSTLSLSSLSWAQYGGGSGGYGPTSGGYGPSSGGYGPSSGGMATGGSSGPSAGGGSSGGGGSCGKIEKDFLREAGMKVLKQCCCKAGLAGNFECEIDTYDNTGVTVTNRDVSIDLGAAATIYLKFDGGKGLSQLITTGNEAEAQLKVSFSGSINYPVNYVQDSTDPLTFKPLCPGMEPTLSDGQGRFTLDGRILTYSVKVEGMARGQVAFTPVFAGGIQLDGEGKFTESCTIEAKTFDPIAKFGSEIRTVAEFRSFLMEMNRKIEAHAVQYLGKCIGDTMRRAITGVDVKNLVTNNTERKKANIWWTLFTLPSAANVLRVRW